MKCCATCNVEKELSEFYATSKHVRKDGTISVSYKPDCKLCHVLAQKVNYNSLWDKYFEAKCSRCGYDKCRSALDLHHVDDTKDFTFASRWSISEVRFAKEASKCIVLCANCHREIHEEMKGP